jgi:ferredoxin
LTHRPSAADVLRWPVIGRFLGWRHARTAQQLVLLLVAAIVVADGLWSPAVAPTSVATILVWVHYRGFLVLALLAAGNVFCMGCPLVFVRDLGRVLHAPRLRWPRRLRTKWVGLALFVAVLFTYEQAGLWALPRATAYLVLAYFLAALTIDVTFSGASFCKYLCPVGQFNFVASTLSPLELRVREPETCRTCRTVDCIKGRRAPDAPEVILQRGCELRLFQPLKVGNLDCTFCLDCVQACPHDNVGLLARVPGAELADPRRRSGIGRLEQRPDIAALVVLFAFGGLVNALGMVQPIYAIEASLSRAWGGMSDGWALAVVFAAVLGVAPAGLLGVAAAVTRLVTGPTRSRGRIVVRYAYAFVPFGFGMWLAHYMFHLLTAGGTIVPVIQSTVIDLCGWAAFGEPRWRWSGMRPGSVFPIQLGLILLGMAGSMGTAYHISERDYPERPAAATAPWAVVLAALTAVAVWILSQPMEMRGGGFLR